MIPEIFIDTSGLVAALAEKDERHAGAVACIERARGTRQRFITTDYILDETVSVLQSRNVAHYIAPLFERIFAAQLCRVEWMDQDGFHSVKNFLLRHSDKGWSFTDCFSFVVMKQRGITEALSSDRHFKQAGFKPLLA